MVLTQAAAHWPMLCIKNSIIAIQHKLATLKRVNAKSRPTQCHEDCKQMLFQTGWLVSHSHICLARKWHHTLYLLKFSERFLRRCKLLKISARAGAPRAAHALHLPYVRQHGTLRAAGRRALQKVAQLHRQACLAYHHALTGSAFRLRFTVNVLRFRLSPFEHRRKNVKVNRSLVPPVKRCSKPYRTRRPSWGLLFGSALILRRLCAAGSHRISKASSRGSSASRDDYYANCSCSPFGASLSVFRELTL